MEPRFKRSFLLTMAVIMVAATAAQAAWVGIDSGDRSTPRLTATQLDGQRTRVDLTLTGYDTAPVTIDGKTYASIVLPGYVQLLERGLPQLPYVTASLLIADEGTPTVQVVKTEYVEFATDPIEPSKGVILRTEDPAAVPYAFGAPYQQGGVFPTAPTEIGDPYIVRDYRGVTLRIYPVQWDADRGVLRVLKHLTVDVVTSGQGGVNPKVRHAAEESAAFHALYSNRFLNFNSASKYQINSSEGPMLIVCYDAFMSAMQPFVEWKQMRGLDVEMIASSSCGGTTTGILDAIQTRYDSPAGLAFVILVGDGQQVPCWSGAYEGANDDTRYVWLEGNDKYPDALVSRISAQNLTQVQTQVTKFVQYERDPQAGADWYHMATGIASNEGSPTDSERADWLRDDLLGYTFSDVDRIYQGQGGTTAGITAAINEGRSLVNYIGHGSGTSWGSVSYTNSNVHSLVNTPAWPWIIDVSCLNGGISALSESFAEAWLRAGSPAAPYGAVGMYASSTSTPWVPPCVMQTEVVNLLVTDASNVLGVLVQGGIMKVVDDYGQSGTGLQLIEQYNLFGDCSMQVRTDTPAALAVSHAPVIPLFQPSFDVDCGAPGVTCTLYTDGVVHGTGVSDASGHATIDVAMPIASVGEVTLTCFGYNTLTYQATLQAVVPANVSVVPATVPVGTNTDVTVTITDPDTGDGLANIAVWITGYGFTSAPATTNAAGQVQITVSPQYGETLVVHGQEVGEGYEIFGVDLPVTGATPLTHPVIAAGVPSIGLDGSLTPHLEGTVTGSAAESGLTLHVHGGGVDDMASDPGTEVTLAVTPTELSDVTAAIVRAGYQVYETTIPVVAAYGTLAGTVLDGSSQPLVGARVTGFVAGSDPGGTPLFDLTTTAAGTYTVPDDLEVGDYDLYVTKFGYLPYSETYFLMYGANDHGITVENAPAGVLNGTITASEDGSPLDASVKVIRTDTGAVYAETNTDPATGAYATTALPYFDYRLLVRAYRRIPQTVGVTVDAASLVRDFALDPTEGDLLVIDDNGAAKSTSFPAKLYKERDVIAPAYDSPPCRSLAEIVADLEDIGYTATVEAAGATDPVAWSQYDALIVTCGNNLSPLSDATLRSALLAFVANGGHVLLEGGELAYDMQYTDATFFQSVLHCASWTHDSAGHVGVADANHYVMSVPNLIAGPVTLSYSGYGDSDAAIPASGAAMVGNWTNFPTDASVICYDENSSPVGGQAVFFSWNYSAAETAGRKALLHNAVNWLITPEVGDGSLSGAVDLSGSGDNGGAVITLTPGNVTTTTDSTGHYSFPGLFAATYHVVATCDGYTSAAADVVVPSGADVTGVDFTLLPFVTQDFCDDPGLAIPDNNTTGISCPITVNAQGELSNIAVYVDITHPYIGDLDVDLVSPAGIVVRLHNHGQGGTDDDIVGWYPDDLTPYELLAPLVGESIQGVWTLHVVDSGAYDAGTVNSWCVRLGFPEGATPVEDAAVPAVVALEGNFPNPFNPQTVIRFSVPRTQRVDLGVYDLRGQKVTTLVSDVLPAGRHAITWTGRDDSGRTVGSGLYVYRLVADGKTLTNKMLLLK